MGVEDELAAASPGKDTVLTIGVFDGVHLGHRFLIATAKEQAERRGMLSGVVTFRRHPQEVVSPDTRLPTLTDLPERERLLKEAGVDFVVMLSFDAATARLSAREFVTLLKKHLRMRGLVVGPDFALGRGREGGAETLSALGGEMGFTLTVLPPITIGREVVSSTSIRNALAAGDMKRVRMLYGRYFSLHGRVVVGDRRGASLGFPTANIQVDPQQALPPDGIYATQAYINGDKYRSVTNIGRRPTFNGGHRTIEVYIIDFSGDLYGRELRIDIVERLREERRFSNIEDLKKQMARDVKEALAVLEGVTAK